MSRGPLLPWLLLALWSTWLHAAQGWLAQGLGPWTPDLGLVLLLGLAAKLAPEQLPPLALAVGLGRLAVSVDPPAAVLAAVLGVTLLARGLRTMLELEGPLQRTLLAGACAALVAAWLEHVHLARAVHAAGAAGALPRTFEGLAAGAPTWRLALATGLAALVLAPLLVRLPGLTPLRRRRSWRRVASVPWS